jgi:predicted TIM-barrel fold metal-dependent hydrolase
MRSAAGMATAFMVLNTVAGLACTGPEAVLPVSADQCDDPDAAAELFIDDYFVMDVQLHHVDTTAFPIEFWRFINLQLGAEIPRFYHPDDPADLSDVDTLALLSQVNFVKEVFVDSETAVGVISGVPDGIPLPVETMAATRDLVNQLSGSERALIQAMIAPNHADPNHATALGSLEHQVLDNGARAIKCYPGSDLWWLDDQQIAYPMYEEATRLGLGLINVHKGFPLGNNPTSADYWKTTDLEAATRDWPDLDFMVYHSGYFPPSNPYGFTPGIALFLDDIATMGPRDNLYAEVGSTFANSLFNPNAAAHLLGQLMGALGSSKIVWGTDSVWWGSPQWQIDAFKVLQIPESMQEQLGYPALNDCDKERILGLNGAALYGVDVEATRGEIVADQLSQLRGEMGGSAASRSHYVYGPESPSEFRSLMAHAGDIDFTG